MKQSDSCGHLPTVPTASVLSDPSRARTDPGRTFVRDRTLKTQIAPRRLLLSTALLLAVELMLSGKAQAQACAASPGTGGVAISSGVCQDNGNTRTATTSGIVPLVSTVDISGNAQYEGIGVTLNGTGTGSVLTPTGTATFSLTNSTINATGTATASNPYPDMAGIVAWGTGNGSIAGSHITTTMSSSDPTTQGATAEGGELINGGTLTISNSTVTATSDSGGADGLVSAGAPLNTIINAVDDAIITKAETAGVANGSASVGVSAVQLGTVNLTGGSVTATNGAAGDPAYGLWAGYGGTINASGASVTSSNIGALNTDSTLVLSDDNRTGTPVHTVITGVQYGILAENYDASADTTVTGTNAQITASAGPGVGLDGGAVVSLTGTTVSGSTAGIATSDVYGTGLTNQLTVDGGSVTATAGPAFLADGGNANILVKDGAQVTAADGTILKLTNASNVTFTAQGETLTGNLIADATSTGNAFLTGGTTLTGMVQNVGTTVDSTSTWNVTASSTPTVLTNAGTVAFVAPTGAPTQAASYKTVTAGSYIGNGGTIALNTYLGADTSPTDQLVVNGGSASGTTVLKITNTAGSGAQTTSDGIPVIVAANGASTAASAFHLAGPVQAGAYEYLLYRGGQSNADSWYLRSDLMPTPAPAPAPAPAPIPTPIPAAAPVAYRPGAVGYTMTPSLNADYGFAILDRLHERVGDLANVEKNQSGNQNGVWGRIGGQSLDADAESRFAADEKTFFAQFGKDWTLNQVPNGGSTHTGVMVTFGTADASFSDTARGINPALSTSTGSMEMHAQSLGGYWTRYLSDGTYFDSVGQLTHYNNRYSDVYGSNASQNGFGVALSQEVGRPFYLGSSAVAIEPQAQLMYQYLKLNGFEDNISAISGTTTNALRGRLGVRAFRANMDNDTRTSAATPYFTADVLHDFFAPGQTVVGGTPFDSGLGRTWYELGVGVTTSFGKSGEFYANVKYGRNLGGQYRQRVFGNAGYRYSW